MLKPNRDIAAAGGLADREDEAKYLAVVKSSGPLKDRMDACKMLARVGGKASVPVLAGLLDDEQMAHMARYALEPNPDPSVDTVFRDALGKLKGLRLVGVIGSVGVRRDEKAAGTLIRLLKDSDAEVAQIAARALGSIGTAEAAKALQGALPGVADGSRLSFCEGLLRCAEALAEAGKRSDAQSAYDFIQGFAKALPHVRGAGLRGAVLSRGDSGIPLLMKALQGGDEDMAQAAARAAMELEGGAVTKAVAGALGSLPDDRKVLAAQVLGWRRDVAALSALSAAAKAGKVEARVAAVRALGEIGNAGAAPVLQALAGDPEGQVAQAAKAALESLPKR